ncbi:hypothetical protein ACHAXR_002433, partial [Thalassiosira sp. AJA248-18]
GRSSPHSANIQLQSTKNADNEEASSSSSSSSSSTTSTIAEMTELEAAQTRETPKLTPDDKSLVRTLVTACAGNVEAMENAITANLDNMHPRLVVALQIAADKKEWKAQDDDDDDEFESQMVTLGTSLQNVLDVNLRSGREMLAELLNAGEIRKLDSLIGKSAKDGKLDMSFFTVLGMNMKDAAMMSDNDGESSSSTSLTPTLATGEGQEQVEGDEGQPIGANRLQILQHIYTRCQEELEKNVPPGIGLLNKLLRTDISSIRTNQLSHYLGPQATSITSPDGKTIDLSGSTAQPLVSHGEFIEALSNAVTQIRTLEAAGGTDRLSAMNLVESIRQVAIEAMGVLVSSFGEESDVVKEFQRDLQPVFRPGSE